MAVRETDSQLTAREWEPPKARPRRCEACGGHIPPSSIRVGGSGACARCAQRGGLIKTAALREGSL